MSSLSTVVQSTIVKHRASKLLTHCFMADNLTFSYISLDNLRYEAS